MDFDLQRWALWVVGALGALFAWLVRKVFTQEKQIALLRQAIEDDVKLRKEQRANTNQQLKTMNESLAELKSKLSDK